MDARFGIAEDDGRGGILDLDQADERAILVQARDGVEDVLRLADVDVVAAQADELGVVHELLRRALDGVWEGG